MLISETLTSSMCIRCVWRVLKDSSIPWMTTTSWAVKWWCCRRRIMSLIPCCSVVSNLSHCWLGKESGLLTWWLTRERNGTKRSADITQVRRTFKLTNCSCMGVYWLVYLRGECNEYRACCRRPLRYRRSSSPSSFIILNQPARNSMATWTRG